MHTICGTVLRTSFTRIRNYADSDGETATGGKFWLSYGAPRNICTVQVITWSQERHSQLVGLVTAVMYQVTGLTCSFVYGLGLQPAGVIHNNLAAYAHHFLHFHVRPANQQPTITGVDLCHKNVRRPWFTETRAIPCQPFILVHNARFHSECYTNHKGSNQTCENNIIPPTNIQCLKIHVHN